MAVVLLIVMPVARLVLGRLYEVHRSATRSVLVTMLAPILCVPRRHVQIDGFDDYTRRRPLDDHRSRIHERRRRPIRKVHTTVNAWDDFASDGDSNADITSTCDRRGCGERECNQSADAK